MSSPGIKTFLLSALSGVQLFYELFWGSYAVDQLRISRIPGPIQVGLDHDFDVAVRLTTQEYEVKPAQEVMCPGESR